MPEMRTIQVDPSFCELTWEPPPQGRCTAEYLDVATARQADGLRLVLTERVPGPWGEAAKAVLHVKGVPYTKVGHSTGVANGELFAWTGRTNAPVAVYRDDAGVDRAIDGWAGILQLADRTGPPPSLYPSDPAERALMLGLSHEICGEGGLGWSRRLMTLHAGAENLELLENDVATEIRVLSAKYGYSARAGRDAATRVCEILDLLAEQLRRQHASGQQYLVGSALSAIDLYWACFSQFLEPYPEELAPMEHWPGLREGYTVRDPEVRKSLAPDLLEHRDFIYREHLELPLDY
jgi:glutathione S-transferase